MSSSLLGTSEPRGAHPAMLNRLVLKNAVRKRDIKRIKGFPNFTYVSVVNLKAKPEFSLKIVFVLLGAK